MRRAVLLLILLSTMARADSAFQSGEAAWRKQRHDRLSSDTGWLTLVALHWLASGPNTIGSVTYTLKDYKVWAHIDSKEKATLNEKPFSHGEMKSDEKGDADVLTVGGLRYTVIKRGDRWGIRVRNPENPDRLKFKEIEYYSPDPKYLIEASFEPYSKPIEREVPNVIGTTEKMSAPGLVKFKWEGKEVSLEPVIEVPGDTELFYIFKDTTSGKETYPAGRFMYSPMPKDGKVTLNFNRAYNPPCAFTAYATCPLPLKQNSLPVKIEAGEKRYGH